MQSKLFPEKTVEKTVILLYNNVNSQYYNRFYKLVRTIFIY